MPLWNIALQYVIQQNCMNIWWCFLMISCTFWRSRKNVWNSPKLSCGFNIDCKRCINFQVYKIIRSHLCFCFCLFEFNWFLSNIILSLYSNKSFTLHNNHKLYQTFYLARISVGLMEIYHLIWIDGFWW